MLTTFADSDNPELISLIEQPLSESQPLKQFLGQPIPQKLVDFIKQPLSPEAISQIQQDSCSHLYHIYPDLNKTYIRQVS